MYVPKLSFSIFESRIKNTPFINPIAKKLPSGLKLRQVAYVPKFLETII
jgi:hypothetical protein